MLDVLALLGTGHPLHKGADRPLIQPIIDAKHVHGDDGLGGAPRPRDAGRAGLRRRRRRPPPTSSARRRQRRKSRHPDDRPAHQPRPGAAARARHPRRHRPAHHHGRHRLRPRQHHAGRRIQHLCRSRGGAYRLHRRRRDLVVPWEPCVTHSWPATGRRGCSPPLPACPRRASSPRRWPSTLRNGVNARPSATASLCRSAGRRGGPRSLDRHEDPLRLVQVALAPASPAA